MEKEEIIPSTLQYYENLAAVIEWYAQHPEERKNQDSDYTDRSKAEDHNPVIEQAKQIRVQDSAGNFVTIFDLSANHRKAFFKSWTKIQAHFMSEKLQRDDSPQHLMGLLPRMRNRAFKRAFPTPESLANTIEDPYKKVSRELISQENRMREAELRYYNKAGKTPPPRNTSLNEITGIPDEALAYVATLGFWTSLYYVLPVKFDGAKRRGTPDHFVKELKPQLRRGRILIALPGGYDTYNVLHTDGYSYFDVGHAAFINKDYWRVVQNVNKNHSITTGIPGPDHNVEPNEKLKGWMKHGRSFVGAVVNGYWKIKWSWFWFVPYPEFFWIKSGEVNCVSALNSARRRTGSGYCHWYQVKFAKWSAPSRFICSTLPWYEVKRSTGKNLGDWWKTTIYPAGLYLSDYVRIVGETNPPIKRWNPPKSSTPSYSSGKYWVDYEKADSEGVRGDGEEW